VYKTNPKYSAVDLNVFNIFFVFVALLPHMTVHKICIFIHLHHLPFKNKVNK